MEVILICLHSGLVPGMHQPLKHSPSTSFTSQTSWDIDFSFMNYDGKHFVISWHTSTSSCPCNKLKGQVEAMKWSISSCKGIYQQTRVYVHVYCESMQCCFFHLRCFYAKQKESRKN